MPTVPEVVVKDSALELARSAADLFKDLALACAEKGCRFSVALSGGGTPRPTHRLFAQDTYLQKIPWHLIHFFWADERCVPPDDLASNFGAAEKDFLSIVPIDKSQIKHISTKASPGEAALRYQKTLELFFHKKGDAFPSFDLMFLGIGEDGHTASLFPGQAALAEKKRWVLAVKGGAPNIPRVTMTMPVIRNAKNIVFLVSGEKKATVLKKILKDGDQNLPAAMVQPLRGRLIWLLDREAAKLVHSS
jgi:6-phosphogluconolactonase